MARPSMAAKAIAPRKGVVAPVTRGRENDELAAVEDIIEIGECRPWVTCDIQRSH